MIKKVDEFLQKNYKLWWSYLSLIVLVILYQFNNIFFDILGYVLSCLNLFLLFKYGRKNIKVKE